jgi:hypothetical protein
MAILGSASMLQAAGNPAPAPYAGWTCVGGDSGMTKYCPDNISAGKLKLDYAKRFFGAWTGTGNQQTPNYHYSSSVVIRKGIAAVMNDDEPKKYTWWEDGVALTLLDWATGTTKVKTIAPGGKMWGNWSFRVGQHYGEIDSHHYSECVLWGDDGRFYARRGGDHFCVGAYDPAAGKWEKLDLLRTAPGYKNWGGDSDAFLTRWQNLLMYRPGDTRDLTPYIGVDISPAAWKSGKQGAWEISLGPFPKSKDKNQGVLYCDYPKANSAGIAVVAGQVTDGFGQLKMLVQATNVSDGKPLWDARFGDVGRMDFGAGAANFHWFGGDNVRFANYYTPIGRARDYWRSIVTDNLYLFYHGSFNQTLVALNIRDGSERWRFDIGQDHPLLASHGNFLYVIGDSRQTKLLLDSGKIVWSKDNHFDGDRGYVICGEDALYRPMVLTDDTLWFIDGSGTGGDHHHLVGLKTSDGSIVQTIDLAAMAKKDGESLLVVNDIAASGGKLGVLVGIQSKDDPHGLKNNRIIYQNLYVFSKQ